MTKSRLALLPLVAALSAPAAPVPEAARAVFTVSMPRPATRYVHVEATYEGLGGPAVDLKMPGWSPGYYVILDDAKNVGFFSARAASGSPLRWKKSAKNAWRVETAGAKTFTVAYDVWAAGGSIAESALDERQAFLSPTGLFLHPAGKLATPVTLTVERPKEWARISTGLDPVAGRTGTFSASDFDVLYDSPLLVGNQEVLSFDVDGVPHTFEGSGLGSLDRARFVADLKAMVTAAVRLMGEIPYRRYAFISIGPGGGGLEHLNSQLVTFAAAKMADPVEYARTMRFLAHEYFHHFNVKRIRPVALGPFDYDRENLTRMLWFSEGGTVYYEDLLLVRDGFFTPQEYLRRLASGLSSYEGSPGRRFQSPAEASFDAWFGYFDRSEHLRNTTVSPYDAGLAVSFLLDLEIRHATRNRRSLDDVMRALYRTYAKEKGRGFTDAEFRRTCEETAGMPLPEIFDRYVATTAPIDWPKYLGYAGLELEPETDPVPGDLGADLEDRGGKVLVTRVGIGSAASLAGLASRDELLAVDDLRGGLAGLRERFAERKPGEQVKVLVARDGKVRSLDVVLGPPAARPLRFRRVTDPTPLQTAIFEGWLKGTTSPN